MKKSLLPAVATIILLGVGCSSSSQPLARPSLPPARVESTGETIPSTSPTTGATTAVATSLYVPPTGADPSSDAKPPGLRRIMTATSNDGLTFTRTNEIVTDQANVPDMVMDADGTLYLYFSGWTVGDRTNALGLAISEDQGESWAFHQVTISGGPDMSHSGDPDVVLLDDGRFRLYSTFALPKTRTQAIFYSEGTDGISFAYGGVAFQSDPPALDSNTFPVGDEWHMYTLVGETTDGYHATSADGKTFERQSRERYEAGGNDMVMSNVLPFDDGYRMYGFSPSSADIRSFWSTDGETWTEERGVRLALDASNGLEAEFVKDPAIIRLENGTYLMVYVTQIP